MVAAIMSTQPSPDDLSTGRETHHMATSQILMYEDHPQHQADGTQVQYDGITMYKSLPRDTHNLQPKSDSFFTVLQIIRSLAG
jgi:hypothetical protein